MMRKRADEHLNVRIVTMRAKGSCWWVGFWWWGGAGLGWAYSVRMQAVTGDIWWYMGVEEIGLLTYITTAVLLH